MVYICLYNIYIYIISRGIFTGMYNQQHDGTNHLTWGYIYIYTYIYMCGCNRLYGSLSSGS